MEHSQASPREIPLSFVREAGQMGRSPVMRVSQRVVTLMTRFPEASVDGWARR
jgi:hypothetical protein